MGAPPVQLVLEIKAGKVPARSTLPVVEGSGQRGLLSVCPGHLSMTLERLRSYSFASSDLISDSVIPCGGVLFFICSCTVQMRASFQRAGDPLILSFPNLVLSPASHFGASSV